MAQISFLTAEVSPEEAAVKETTRLHFLDHLRAALVILVVLHHVALVYGAGAPFYYVEPPLSDPLAYLVLLVFVLFNQAWFMSALFCIAGYFTPGSFDRKGSGAFLKARLIRLGIPLLVWIFVISPLSSIGYWSIPAEYTGITDPLTFQAYPFLLGLGVAWFLALLLIFNIGYAAWRRLTRNRAPSAASEFSPPGYIGIGIFVLALALLSYLVRTLIPMGREVLDFPTLSYLAQYLSFFIVGAVAYRGDWFRTIPGSTGAAGFVTAVAATILLFPLALSGSLLSLELAEPASWVGNGTWQSAVYALWDSIFAAGMFLAALTLFRRFFNEKSRLGTFLSRQSYAVYIIHVPIIVFLAIALKEIIDLAPLAKFAVISLIVVPTCFIVAWLIRKIPGVSRVI
jgi:fucose 4-O-acetylase-like acetyltransferase